MSPRLDRRRFIAVTAVASLGLLPLLDRGHIPPVEWQGTAMGAPARITLYHPNQRVAERLIGECVAEIIRVEELFSLFRRDSKLVTLNRDGRLTGAPAEFVELVTLAQHFSAISGGAFDVTIQPLWRLYARHFAAANANPDGPTEDDIAAATALVGWRDLGVNGSTVTFARSGMEASFNGIAQGWVTDRVADLLRSHGIADVLLDLGEMRAMGGHPDGRPWRAGLADPRNPEQMFETVEIRDQAAATSGGYGTVFDSAGRFHHMFNPATGRPASTWLSITVMAPTATAADALTKAVALAPPERVASILKAGGGTAARLMASDGSILRVG